MFALSALCFLQSFFPLMFYCCYPHNFSWMADSLINCLALGKLAVNVIGDTYNSVYCHSGHYTAVFLNVNLWVVCVI